MFLDTLPQCLSFQTEKPFPYFSIPEQFSSDEVWQWDCVSGRCEKFQMTEETKEFATSLGVCKMLCNEFGKYVFTCCF